MRNPARHEITNQILVPGRATFVGLAAYNTMSTLFCAVSRSELREKVLLLLR